MKRYFLGLALALFAIPGVSRADVVDVITTSGIGSQGNSLLTNSRTITFTNSSSPLNELNAISLRLHTGAGNGGTLSLTFTLGGASTGSKTVAANSNLLNNDVADYTWDLSGLSVVGGSASTLNIAYDGGTFNSTIAWRDLSGASFGGTWGGSASMDTNSFLTLAATVPEPTTMLLTGSVLAVGFGASVVRRLRKKSGEQLAI